MHLRTRLTLGLATAAALTGAALTPVAANAVTPNAQLTIDASSTGTDLLDGQVVLLDGSGYTPNAQVYVVQCADLATGDPASCDGFDGATNLDKVVFATADAAGNLTDVPFTVHTGPTGTQGDVCDATNPACGIAATDSLDPTAAGAHFGAVGITFAKVQGAPRSNLHAGDKVTVTGVALDPNIYVALIQCGPDAQADGSGCDTDPADATITQTDATGAFTAQFTVLTGEMDAGDPASACPPPAGSVAPCTIVAEQIDLATLQPVATLGILPISFAPPPVDTVLSAKSTKSTVAKGKKFAIKGTLKAAGVGLNGAKVKLYKITKSGATKLAAKTTATNSKGVKGAFKFGGLTQKRTSKYQVRFAGGTIGGTDYNASKSKVVKVVT